MAHRTTRTTTWILTIVAAGIVAVTVTFPIFRSAAAEPAGVETGTGEMPARIPEPAPSPEEQELIDWAYGLYEAAGLELPPVEIGFYDTKEPCEGSKGTYRPQPDGLPKVRVCDWHERENLRDAWRRKTLVHELAHAWTAANLDEAERNAFGELRGTPTWNDREEPWERRANEHASEIITWGLLDRRVRIDSRIDGRSCDDLAEGFRFLTGAEPDGGLAFSCDI